MKVLEAQLGDELVYVAVPESARESNQIYRRSCMGIAGKITTGEVLDGNIGYVNGKGLETIKAKVVVYPMDLGNNPERIKEKIRMWGKPIGIESVERWGDYKQDKEFNENLRWNPEKVTFDSEE